MLGQTVAVGNSVVHARLEMLEDTGKSLLICRQMGTNSVYDLIAGRLVSSLHEGRSAISKVQQDPDFEAWHRGDRFQLSSLAQRRPGDLVECLLVVLVAVPIENAENSVKFVASFERIFHDTDRIAAIPMVDPDICTAEAIGLL